MVNSLDISTSALVAQRVRLNAISSNLANMSTTHNELGEPEAYKPRFAVFQTSDDIKTSAGGVGVDVKEVRIEDVEPRMVYSPGHPDRIREGRWTDYVAYPNVDMTREFTDALAATRAYEANVGVIEITKNLGQQTLRILA